MTPTAELPTLPAFIAERLSAPRPVALAERRDGRTVSLSAQEVHARAAAVAHALRSRFRFEQTISAIADYSQIVRNRLRLHPKFGHNAGFIAQCVAPAVQLNDSRAHNTLTEIFVRCTN